MLLGVMTPAFKSSAGSTGDCRSPTAQAGRAVSLPFGHSTLAPVCLLLQCDLFPAVRYKTDLNFGGKDHDPRPQFNKPSWVKMRGDSCQPSQSLPKASLAFFWQREWQKELRSVIKMLADLSFASSCFFIYSVKIACLRKTAQLLDLIISLTYANPGAYEKEGGQRARF